MPHKKPRRPRKPAAESNRVEHFLFGGGRVERIRIIDSGECADIVFDEGKPRTILTPWLTFSNPPENELELITKSESTAEL